MRADRSPAGWPDGSSALPIPAGWTGQRLPVWLKLSMGSVAAMALGLAAEAAWLSWTGQPVTGVPLAAAAIYLGHVVGLGTCLWWRRRRSSRTGTLTAAPDGARGVTFTYSAWSYYWLTALLVMSELVVLAVTAGAALSATAVGVLMAVVIGVLAVVVGSKQHRQRTPGYAATWADSGRGSCNSCPSWSSAPSGSPPTQPPSTTHCPSTAPIRAYGPSWAHLTPSTGSAAAEQ